MTDVQTGTVKWFNDKKGYGFIVNEAGEDVLVHHKAILMEGYRRLDDGQEVVFKQFKTEQGYAAAEVEVVETA